MRWIDFLTTARPRPAPVADVRAVDPHVGEVVDRAEMQENPPARPEIAVPGAVVPDDAVARGQWLVRGAGQGAGK